jgi:Domain of unknown function (DUF1992)
LLASSVKCGLMTERKPRGMSFGSWIDQQIDEAADRGAFDNLPGAGKPLPNRGDEDAGQAWLREYVLREGVPAEDLLPPPLKLRKERERLAESVQGFRSEQAVLDACDELNQRILQWRRFPSGPPIFVPLVDTEAMIGAWREGQLAGPAPASSAAGSGSEPATQPERSAHWWRRIGKRPGRVTP